MWINTPSARLAVASHRALRLKDARGARVRAVLGTLWVTIDNDPRDIVLEPGESFTVESDRALVVMPLGACATLDVRSAASSPAPAARLGRWLKALWPQTTAIAARA